MDDENIYSLTCQLRMLENLSNKRQLENELKTQMQLLSSMKESFIIFDEITSLPNTFCDIVVQKDQPFLEIDSKSGKCLRDIKDNVLETFTKNLHNCNEIKFPENLEISVEKLHVEMQEQKEKNKTLSCLLNNFEVISDSIKGDKAILSPKIDKTINIDDISSIKSDSGAIKARDLFAENFSYVDDCNETVKDVN